MFKNIFSSGKKNKLIDFSEITVDMHSHLIPGIDDGAQSIDESIALIKNMHELGYKKLIITPHVMQDSFRNTNETIIAGLNNLKKHLNENDINIEVDAAAEYLLDYSFEEIFKSRKFLSFGNKHVLIELAYFNPPENLESVLFEMQIEGYKPILAHPERYPYWYGDFEHYQKLKDRGVYFQLNAISLTGYYSLPTKKIAEKLIDNNMIEFIGSDLHNQKYFEELEKSACEKYFKKLMESGKLLNKQLL
ncbi:MAG: CpsB/CapC family capsule biosynthesis tyrosine phosphatase [Bacteroidales bacterium]|jgi:tyrosine-protein phosphatase YwqE